MASLYGMVRAMCICGVRVMTHLVVPSIACEFAILFPMMHACALTFWMVMLCWNHVMHCIVDVVSILFGWLYWEDGVLMCLLLK